MHRVNVLFNCAQSYGGSKHLILKKLQGVQSSNFQNIRGAGNDCLNLNFRQNFP